MEDLLASRIKRGDNQAFELFFRKYYVRLCCYSNKFIQNYDESCDIVSDAFLKIWENRNDIDTNSSLVSLVFKITRNLSLNHLRYRKVESKYLEILKVTYIDNSELSSYETYLGKELENEIQFALNKIPAQCKKVFELSRKEGLKYLQIAERLNISVKTVEVHMSKALRILRSELADFL
ncbi:MAG TPA: RNA polymerase sigma-70 factor [Bacteroidales bacterium]|nr:RNA polymerase sigma-70 factor [Bacteroidales bacterium]